MPTVYEMKDRSDQQLLTGVKELVGREREATAQPIAHLGEIDARRLFLAEGCSSLFKYCTDVLHLSEPSAYNRIDVARVARKFPIIFEKLAEGSIHLSAARILGPCLTPLNHLALLEAAKHQSKEEVERIAATVRPRPDVPSVVRKLPERAASGSLNAESATALFDSSPSEFGKDPETAQNASLPVSPTPAPLTAPRQPAISALSPGRYKIEFTADEETREALRQLQDLLRHQMPKGDPAMIFKKALLLLLNEVQRERLGQVKRPRKKKLEAADLWQEGGDIEGAENVPIRESRHIPADVKRSVWQRDKGQCAFVSRNGRRCSERGRLEFHHVHAYALGGPATIENIALRCRAHNAHESRVLFGENGKKLTRSGASSGMEAGTRSGREPMKEGASSP